MDLSSAELIAPIVALCSAVVAVASVVVTVAEGRAARRNTEFLAHRDQWWNRWTWIAERAHAPDAATRDLAEFMALALRTRRWSTVDDRWVADELYREEIPEDGGDVPDHE
jgi:hypothetical protein